MSAKSFQGRYLSGFQIQPRFASFSSLFFDPRVVSLLTHLEESPQKWCFASGFLSQAAPGGQGAAGLSLHCPAAPGSHFALPDVPGDGAVLETVFWALCSGQCVLGYKPQVNHVLYKMKHLDPVVEGHHLNLLASHITACAIHLLYDISKGQGSAITAASSICILCVLHTCMVCSQTRTPKKPYRGPVLGSSPLRGGGFFLAWGCRSHSFCRKAGEAGMPQTGKAAQSYILVLLGEVWSTLPSSCFLIASWLF